jgi:TRAP-type transport system periplasmic protein
MINRIACHALLLCAVVWQPAACQTIKLASLAPAGSSWDLGLKQIAADWKKVSNGSVVVKIYPGGIAGDESDVIRKIRISQLQAAGLTGAHRNRTVPHL